MAEKNWLVDLNLNQNELRAVVLENLPLAPESGKEGQIYFHSVTNNKKLKYYRDGSWKKLIDEDDLSSFVPTYRTINGKALTSDIILYGTDIAMSSSDTTTLKVAIDGKQATITGAATTITTSNLTNSRAVISNGSGKIAVSDTTSTELEYVHGVTSNIQTQLNNKINKHSSVITAATKCKITYNSDGLVTGGSDLEATDIPAISLSKINDVTATASEVNVLDGITATTTELNYTDGVTSNIQTQLNGKENTSNKSDSYTVSSSTTYASTKALVDGLATKQATISDIVTIRNNAEAGANAAATIASYGDIVTHDADEFATAAQGAKADTALQSSDIINDVIHTDTDKPLSANMGKELSDRIANIANIGKYLANWNATTGLPTTNPSTSLPYVYTTGMYYVVSVVGSTNYKPNGSSYTGAASTTLETGNLAVGDFYIYDGTNWNLLKNTGVTTVFSNIGGDPYDNTNLANALNLKAPLASPALTGTPTAPTAATGTNTTQIATTAFVQSAIASASLIIAVNNPALTASSGVCTWTISNTLNNADVICTIKEVSTGEEIYTYVKYSASTITIKINSSSNITANTYRAVIIGQKVN